MNAQYFTQPPVLQLHHHRAREMWGAGHEEEARALQVWPLDEHNIATLDAVRPRGWEDPPPAAEYDLIAIGAGAGGLVAAKQSGRRGARSLGLRVWGRRAAEGRVLLSSLGLWCSVASQDVWQPTAA